MTPAEQIKALADRAQTELNAAHDYYVDTKMAWDIVHKSIKAGRKFKIRNLVTGTVTNESQLALKARDYVKERLAAATFLQFVAVFENFFFDFLRLWLTAFPQSLGAKQLPFKMVLESPDKDGIVLEVVDKEVNEIAYKRPKDWFEYLEERAKLGCPTADEIDRISEIKATRDIVAHHRGIANRIYMSKAGKLARANDGDKLEIPEAYHRSSWELILRVIEAMAKSGVSKIK